MKHFFVVLTSTMLFACGGGSGSGSSDNTKSPVTGGASPTQSVPQPETNDEVQTAEGPIAPAVQSAPQSEPKPNEAVQSVQAPENTHSSAVQSTPQQTREVQLPEPTFTLNEAGPVPLRGQIVSGNLVTQPDYQVGLEWQIDQRGVSQCTVTPTEPTCSYTITSQDEGHFLRLCSVAGEQSNCTEEQQLPQISFTGLLNYKGEVSAQLPGFSEQLEIGWYLSDTEVFDIDTDGPGRLAPGMNEELTYQLQVASHNARDYVHHFLTFCVNDRARLWETTCRVVGTIDSIYPSRQGIDTLFPIFADEYKKQQLVGGELLERGDTHRRIAPVLAIKHEFRSYTSYINRPITSAELDYFQFTLAPMYSTKYRKEKQGDYPSLMYKYEDDEDTRENPYDNIITTADDLCSSIGRRLPEAIQFERSDFTDSGWPMKGYPFGLYWTASREIGAYYPNLATDIVTGESYTESDKLLFNVACGHNG
ncbi:hypothetical protein [Photobacterium sp.]|uniref:hypothetical protein n=1 Tax=Photobacterium sp. TaxID=660 RepID=UPI00299E2DE1|nr:hypothetical protein [Photobacterium sp.]MDX1301344.1 hypothetical protein [Photobacterium sp.]